MLKQISQILPFLLVVGLLASACASSDKKNNTASGGENQTTKEEATASIATATQVAAIEQTAPKDDTRKIYISDTNEDGTPRTFEQVLASLRGKVVYVDFWASWCPPCRQQMPAAKILHSQFEGKEVAFLYVSFDRTGDAWRNGIEQMDINGYHFFPKPEQLSAVAQTYNVMGIPRYMIVDKSGKIVNADAPRPSSSEIAGLLNKLL
jgi:thiol-disulfide isomerase/thioredoxin